MEFLHAAVWHDRDIDFARWLHPAMWHVALESWQWIHQVAAPCNVYVALGWHAIKFAQTYAILEYYIWFRFRPHHRSRQSTCHSAPVSEILSKSNHPRQKKMTSCRFSRWRISAILDFRDPIMGSLKSPGTTSYRSSIDTIALNCLVFEKIAFLYFDDRQTNKQTNKQMDSSDALSSSGYRERRLNKKLSYHKEAARCSLSLKILPSFNFQFYTVEYGECVSSY